MSKAKIYEFDPVIYHTRLFVAKGGTTEDMVKDFTLYNGDEISFNNAPTFVFAWTCRVIRKENNERGIIVWFPKGITIEAMAHESFHATLYMCGDMNMALDDENNEHGAYIMGWICECIDKVRTNKIKDK